MYYIWGGASVAMQQSYFVPAATPFLFVSLFGLHLRNKRCLNIVFLKASQISLTHSSTPDASLNCCLSMTQCFFGPGDTNGSTNDCNHSTQQDIFPAVKLSFILWTHQTSVSLWAWLVVLANSINKLSHLFEESIICCICWSDSSFFFFWL